MVWEFDIDYIKNISEHALRHLRAGSLHWMLEAGECRGGHSPLGGIMWCDWRREFKPVSGYNQVVGHTRKDGDIRFVSSSEGSRNWCLDSNLQHYAIFENNDLEIKEIK
jgi:hypothetical protein